MISVRFIGKMMEIFNHFPRTVIRTANGNHNKNSGEQTHFSALRDKSHQICYTGSACQLRGSECYVEPDWM